MFIQTILGQDKNSNGNHTHGLLGLIAREALLLNDWLSGPPMDDRDRMRLALAETEFIRQIGPQPHI